MKLLKIISGFIIFYFTITVIDTIGSLGVWLSRGNVYIYMGYYVFIGILCLVYLVVPILSYLKKPTMKRYKLALSGDDRALKKTIKHLKKYASNDECALIPSEKEGQQDYIVEYLKTQSASFKKISKSYALKVSATVMLSPNSFIDGLTILLSNSKMIHELSNLVQIRYSWKELFKMYFSTLAVASVSGLIEEFDDAVIDAFEELLEEIGEKLSEEAGKAISDSIPFVNIAAKSMSFIIQSSINYAFIIYNGRRFYYMVEGIYDEKDDKAIQKLSRKEARWSRIDYVKQLSSQLTGKITKKRNPEDKKRFFKKKVNES